jgi:hypothetical protein
MLAFEFRTLPTRRAGRQRLPSLQVPPCLGGIGRMCLARDLTANGPVQTSRAFARHRSPLTPVLLPVAKCVPYGAALVTSPVRVGRDDRGQRPEFLRSALRTFRRFQRAIIGLRCGSFPPRLKRHDWDSRVRMISVIVCSGRCAQVNTPNSAIHRATRSKGRMWTADMKPSQMALVRADRTIRTQKSEPVCSDCTSSRVLLQAAGRVQE